MKILKCGMASVILLALAAGFMSCMRGGTLSRITVTPANPTLATGTRHQFTATAVFSDGTSLDWTTAVVWTSSDPAAVTVSNVKGSNGIAHSLATGTFIITATDEISKLSGAAELTVTNPLSISITPRNPFMAADRNYQFNATALLGDLTTGSTTTITQNLTSSQTLSWSIDNTGDLTTATTSSTGLVRTGAITGTATILATDTASGMTGTTTLTITSTPLESIAVSPADQTITQATQLQFTAQGAFQDGSMLDLTSSVTWHSSNTEVATISNTAGTYGLVTALATSGTTTIRATDPIRGYTKATTLYVTP